MDLDPNPKDIFVEKNFFSQEIPFEGRAAAFNNLFFNFKDNWKISFGLMLTLSVGIASLGLSEDSAATIIGAMIIAPLGQPIIALGGAIALGWRKETFQMLIVIIIGSVSAVAISFLFGAILNDGTPNQQMLIRTSPDLRDLGIALFAGAAGAYGYYRSEYSTVLAGVAIAVALVPPLCVFGLMLQAGHYILANGSLLLFITNFIGIAFAAILVFFLLGMRYHRNRRWFYIGTIVVIIMGISIIFPLALNFTKFNSMPKFQSSIYAKAGKIFNQANNSPNIKKLTIQGTAVIITIHPFPNNADEEIRLTRELEKSIGLQIFLQKTSKNN
ncbi:MAG: DUF389 domain-containing protein [Bacteroidota bacterium]|nr:DUF389 domain-containing protein [Bacteroidota bacterium]